MAYRFLNETPNGQEPNVRLVRVYFNADGSPDAFETPLFIDIAPAAVVLDTTAALGEALQHPVLRTTDFVGRRESLDDDIPF